MFQFSSPSKAASQHSSIPVTFRASPSKRPSAQLRGSTAAGRRANKRSSATAHRALAFDNAADDAEQQSPGDEFGLYQVLELVLCHQQDIKALIRASTLSQHLRQHVLRSVQLRAPDLLVAWRQRPGYLSCLRWLCNTAGRDWVNAPDVSCSLVELTRNSWGHKPECVVDTLKEAGLQLTNALIVHACKQRLPDISCLLHNLPSFGANKPHKRVLRSFAILATDKDVKAMQDIGVGQGGTIEQFVSARLHRVKAADIMDALHIACSYVLQERAVLTAGMLLDHDRDVVQLLQPGKSAAISMGAADGVVVQDPHTRATQLVVQVIATCVMCQNVPILTRLIQLPAAQDIDTQTVTRLLQSAISGNTAGGAKLPPSGDVIAQLVALPWAADISSTTTRELFEDMIYHKAETLAPLFVLPAARELALLAYVVVAAYAGLPEAVKELGRFALTLKPQRADLVTLVKDLISSPLRWHALNTYNSATCFADLTGLNLWSGLTGDDVMELLEYCTERGFMYAWSSLVGLPALGLVTDTPRFLDVYKRALLSAGSTQDASMPAGWHSESPLARSIHSCEWLGVFEATLRGPLRCIHPELMKHLPVVLEMMLFQDWDESWPAGVGAGEGRGAQGSLIELLRLAARAGDGEAVIVLAVAIHTPIPVAVMGELVASLCAAAASAAPDAVAALKLVLKLPAAPQLSTPLPGAEQLSGAAVAHGMKAAVSLGLWQLVMVFASLPAAHQLDTRLVQDTLFQLLQQDASSIHLDASCVQPLEPLQTVGSSSNGSHTVAAATPCYTAESGDAVCVVRVALPDTAASSKSAAAAAGRAVVLHALLALNPARNIPTSSMQALMQLAWDRGVHNQQGAAEAVCQRSRPTFRLQVVTGRSPSPGRCWRVDDEGLWALLKQQAAVWKQQWHKCCRALLRSG